MTNTEIGLLFAVAALFVMLVSKWHGIFASGCRMGYGFATRPTDAQFSKAGVYLKTYYLDEFAEFKHWDDYGGC